MGRTTLMRLPSVPIHPAPPTVLKARRHRRRPRPSEHVLDTGGPGAQRNAVHVAGSDAQVAGCGVVQATPSNGLVVYANGVSRLGNIQAAPMGEGITREPCTLRRACRQERCYRGTGREDFRV